MMDLLSLYIHIPFCRKKCLYCDFLSFDHCLDQMEPYLEKLLLELKLNSPLYLDKPVKSIFIGGGTPSLLSAEQITLLMETISDCFHVLPEAEITIECNPGTITESAALAYRRLGINRISMGLQAIQPELLKGLGRIHQYEQFLANYKLFRALGFDNINVDLMFGLPGQTIKDWEETLN